MSEKVGRTFYDFVAENKILALVTVALIAFAIYEGYRFSFPGGFSITPPNSKRDTVEIPIKPPTQNPYENPRSSQVPIKPIQDSVAKIELFPISGKIEDENGKSVGSVQVSGKGITTWGDEYGRFEINLPFKSMTDEVILTFEKEGFETYSQSFNRSQSQLTIPVKLKKKN